MNDKFKMDHINDNDKTYEKCKYCNNNLNKLLMNDANRAYKNIHFKTHISLNKSFKSIESNNLIKNILVKGWYKQNRWN